MQTGKRQKELARAQRKREKDADRAKRKEEKANRPPRRPGDPDPDLEGIVPGPQPTRDD